MATIVQLQAPKDMPEGFIFEAEADGVIFPVTVPPGGVKRGQTMQVPFPVVAEAVAETGVPESVTTIPQVTTVAPITTVVSAGTSPPPAYEELDTAPRGRWRNQLCECCDTCCSARCWMAGCCFTSWCFLGQLLQRMNLNIVGQPTSKGVAENTCRWFSCIAVLAYFLSSALQRAGEPFTTLASWISLASFVWILAVGTCLRIRFRRKYEIPSGCCGEGCCEDCCCMCWCACCNYIQMSRHTHDEKVHEYDCFSTTGLRPEAPEVV